ncbi:MAG: SAM-dependent chlorinase/fluorinase [Vicinamibacteria bacterium]|jgi:hypothetical protein|nr:SAM-dependent chlorinase/fluorinase [Vicinamibacteria bacterium]
MRPIVALLTDFGSQNHFVAAVKGAILSVCPEATLVDVLHDLPPFDIANAAFELHCVWRYFPRGTVFVVVVDPGVGSPRRALACETEGRFFIGPDNGLFTWILREQEARLHAITNMSLSRAEIAPTFHARDIFGPLAGHLARGIDLEEVGPRVGDPVLLDVPACVRIGGQEWQGSVIHIDRFGNITTNLSKSELLTVGSLDASSEVILPEKHVRMPLRSSYATVSLGSFCAVVGSSGFLEISRHRAPAASRLGVACGDRLRIVLAEGQSGIVD